MVTVFLSISNQMEFHLAQNQKENCHHNHIPFNVKGNGNIVFSVTQYTKDMQNPFPLSFNPVFMHDAKCTE